MNKEQLQGVVQGDNNAWTQLDSEASRMLPKVVGKYGVGVEDAEDIKQESLIRLWNARGRVDVDDNLMAYLSKTAQNLAVDLHRKEVRRPTVSYEAHVLEDGTQIDLVDHSPSLEERVIQFEEAYEGLMRVPEKDRDLMRMKAEGMRGKEMSEITGIHEGTIKTRINRARERARI